MVIQSNLPTVLAAALVEGGRECDQSGAFPDKMLKLLADAGFCGRFSSRGWTPDSVFDLMDTLRLIGRADLSLGRLYEGHVNALHLIAWCGTPEQQRLHRQQSVDGRWYGVWATELPPGVKLRQIKNETTLTGVKAFASGAGSIDFAVVTASTGDGPPHLVIVPANDARRADISNWTVRGMRATNSGRYDLGGLAVTPDMNLGEPGCYGQEPRFTAGAWRFTAVQLGGLEALVTETRAAMTDKARADPLQREKFALAVEAMRSAYFWVREAALRFAQNDIDAIAIAQMTRGVVERAALDTMSLAARIVGTRSAFNGERIDKITRDLSLYLRQANPDLARDQAASAWLDRDPWRRDDRLW